MIWQIQAIDRNALPTALLPIVKAHCNVTFTDDDPLLQTYTAIALGQLERVWGFQIFGLTGKWVPELPAIKPLDMVPTPVSPASGFTAKDENGVDTTALFELINKGQINEPNFLATLDGTDFPVGTEIILQAGFATLDTMPPEALGATLQVTARLYEFRENVAAFSVNQMPMWMNDLLVGLWQPRV